MLLQPTQRDLEGMGLNLMSRAAARPSPKPPCGRPPSSFAGCAAAMWSCRPKAPGGAPARAGASRAA